MSTQIFHLGSDEPVLPILPPATFFFDEAEDVEPTPLTVFSYGGGQDSFALLVRYIKDEEFRRQYAPDLVIVVMAKTVNEHPHTYTHIEEVVKPLCAEHAIFFHEIDPAHYNRQGWCGGLVEHYRSGDRIGSKAYPKSCTDNLKIVPIYAFLNDYVHAYFETEKREGKGALKELAVMRGKINMIIGIARGEERRVSDGAKDPVWMKKSIRKLYPLIDLGMNRRDCIDYVTAQGYTPPFPSNCMFCPYTSEIELLWLYRTHPRQYAEWVQLEANKIEKWKDKGPKNFGVFGTRLLPEVLERAIAKYGHMSDEEVIEHKFSHGHCVMSKY